MSFCTPLDWCPNLPVKVGQKTNPALEEDWLLMRLYAPSDTLIISISGVWRPMTPQVEMSSISQYCQYEAQI